jgi:RsiW-degrading membrane proteinase PrsW (M82 family)
MKIVFALLPVIIFLLILIFLDSFKLVRIRYILLCLLWGVLCAIASYFANSYLLAVSELDVISYARYVSPFIEEFLKMLFILLLIRTNKIGFIIDGAIYGFAIGTGFALIENLYYLFEVDSGNMGVWLVRGLGTAIMHGGTTSIMAIIIMRGVEQQKKILHVTGFAFIIAVFIHSFFNHFVLPPIIMMFFTIFTISILEFLIFIRSEKSLRSWLELEFDSEIKMLSMIRKGKFIHTRSGEYLLNIKDRFTDLIVVDMLAYIYQYLELSIKAKSNLLLHEAGVPVPKDPDIDTKLKELKSLEKNIGTVGMLAISPILRLSKKDLWKWSFLK